MVAAHLTADGNATPRAHRLLQQDGRTQTVIATFIGAFIYALTMTVMRDLDVFQQDDYALIYIFTVGILVLVVVAVLRWVAHLAGLGSVEGDASPGRGTRAVMSANPRRLPFHGRTAPCDRRHTRRRWPPSTPRRSASCNMWIPKL